MPRPDPPRRPTRPSARSGVAPFHVMEVLAAAKARQRARGDALLLCTGQPATPAPRRVRAAAAAAAAEEVLGYTEAAGDPALRAAIAAWHRGRYGTAVTAEQVVVTTGVSGALILVFLAALDPGDEVVLARPGYPAYRNTLAALGAEVVELDCGPDTRHQLTAEMLAALPRPPRAVIVTSPDNPTGTIIDEAELARIARWCAAHGTLLISDEIYHGIDYGRRCASALESSAAAVVAGGFSKYFSMTGWRLGWLILPDELVGPVTRLAANLTVCPPAVSQAAAAQALHPESLAELDGHVRRYRDNRDLLLEGLAAAGIDRVAPADGAFYLWADVSDYTEDSLAWCAELLDRTGVALAPGVDFDAVHGGGRVRLCYAGAPGDLAEACRRLSRVTGRA